MRQAISKEQAAKLRKIIYALCWGYSDKEAAAVGGITPKTLCAWKKRWPDVFAQVYQARKGEPTDIFKMERSWDSIEIWANKKRPEFAAEMKEVKKEYMADIKLLKYRKKQHL